MNETIGQQLAMMPPEKCWFNREEDYRLVVEYYNRIVKMVQDGENQQKREFVKILKDMQFRTVKCVGFIVGHVAKAWVVQDLLGKCIEELGGTPYVIENGKLIDPEGGKADGSRI